MSFAGGTAAKLGEKYERWWTVNRVLAVLRGEAQTIEIEPLGAAGTGIEFLLSVGDRVEAHQVKRRVTGKGRWTRAALRDEGVLKAFAYHLREGRYPVFVSEDSADILRDLSERSAAAGSLAQFREDALGKNLSEQFDALCADMGFSEEEAFRLLPRVLVRGATEIDLEEWNNALAERLFDEAPAVAVAVLEKLVASKLHEGLSADSLWKLATEEPFNLTRAKLENEALLAESVAATVEMYVAPLVPLRLRTPIPRSEPSRVLEYLRDESNNGVLVAGAAGIGKSDIMVSVIEGVRAAGWPILCLRADRLKPTGNLQALGEQLGLSGSPTSTLDAIAHGGPSLLVIDQLDAVSLASGRLTGLWDPVYTLIRQAAALPGMRVLIACRQFDLQGDWRLRTLSSEEHGLRPVNVEALSSEQVAAAAEAIGISPSLLSPRQQELLRVPLHLTLLDALSARGEIPSFETATDLLAAFWERKREDVAIRSDGVARFGLVTSRLANFMSEDQSLSMPAALLDEEDISRDADVLVSEHVLVRDRDSYAFVHESVFDYAFARGYLAKGGRVVDLLRSGEQDLFRRGQVRQLLVQERDVEWPNYVLDLRELIDASDIRFHIKEAVFGWLAALPAPTREEAAIVRDVLLCGSDEHRFQQAWRVAVQAPWFDALDDQGLVEDWLADSDRVNMGVSLLGAVASARADRAATLLARFDDGSPEWLSRIAYVVRFGDVHQSRSLFECMLSATKRGAFQPSSDHDAWLYAHELPTSEPSWAGELLAVLLERELARVSEQASDQPLGRRLTLDNEHSAEEFVVRLSKSGPAELLEPSLAFFFGVIDLDLQAQDGWDPASDQLPVDRVWGWRNVNHQYGFGAALLGSMVNALQSLSNTDPDAFLSFARSLAARRDDSSQFLLYRALVGNPGDFADFAASVLLEGGWRYPSGYLDQTYWATYELLQAIAPHLSSSRAQELEAAFVDWTSAWERSVHGRRGRGLGEFNLLSGLQAVLSESGHRRLLELQRRFATDLPPEPRGIVGGTVQSPISLDEGRRMDDAAWLRAIAKHRETWAEKRSADLIGGADELASVLQAMAQEQPARFAALGARLPLDTLPTYVHHLLIGLSQPAESAERPEADEVWTFLRHVAQTQELRELRYLPRAVAQFADSNPPADVLAMVTDIAEHAPDPDGELWDTESRSGGAYYGGDIWMAGMNSDRGAAAEAIARLLHTSEQFVGQLEPAVQALAHDRSVAVRACAAEAIGGLMRWRRDDAVSLTLDLVDCDDRLLATPPVARLIAAAQSTHWTAVRPIVQRMLASEFDVVRHEGASLACLASLQEESAAEMATGCVESEDASIRKGAAAVFANNLRFARFADRCAAALIKLFEDADASVREEAAKVFWHLQDDDLGRNAAVGLAFIQSPACLSDRGHFLQSLERSTADVSRLTLALSRRLVQDDHGSMADISRRGFGDGRDLSLLLVRVLASRRKDPDGRSEALDLIDRLLAIGAWGVADALTAAER